MELSPLFSDDARVAEAASIAQKLRKAAFYSSKAVVTLYFHELSLLVCIRMLIHKRVT